MKSENESMEKTIDLHIEENNEYLQEIQDLKYKFTEQVCSYLLTTQEGSHKLSIHKLKLEIKESAANSMLKYHLL